MNSVVVIGTAALKETEPETKSWAGQHTFESWRGGLPGFMISILVVLLEESTCVQTWTIRKGRREENFWQIT